MFPSEYNFKNVFYFILFLERRERREKERERNINMWLLLVCPLLSIWPTTQACALAGNRTNDLFVRRLVFNPLEPHQPELNIIFIKASGINNYLCLLQNM